MHCSTAESTNNIKYDKKEDPKKMIPFLSDENKQFYNDVIEEPNKDLTQK